MYHFQTPAQRWVGKLLEAMGLSVQMYATLWLAFAGIAFLVAGCLSVLLAVRHFIKIDDLETHHAVTDPLLQVVGMMFAILLGFMVSDAMQRFAQARSTVQQEAASVADVFRLADGFSDSDRNHIQKLCITYVDQVVNDEWPKLTYKKTSNKVWHTYDELWSTLSKLKAKDESQASVLQCILPCMVSVGDNRRMRIEALNNGLSPVLWIVLGIAGVATVLFACLFGAKSKTLQMVMIAIITIVMGLNVFMLASYDDPFSGDVRIGPDAFIVDQRLFRTQTDKNDPYEKE